MHARRLFAGAIAAIFLAGAVIPERVHASPADGIIGLAAGMILGGALAQGQPRPQPQYRTYRQRRPSVQRKVVRQPSAAQQVRQQLRKPKRVASDPFMDE